MAKVSVVACNGRLRLEWRPVKGGKKKYLYVGSDDTPLERGFAQQTAIQIQNDLATGNYDPTLRKYKGAEESLSKEPVVKCFTRFIEHKEKHDLISKRTLEKYKAVLSNLEWFFGERRTISSITQRDTQAFRDWLVTRTNPQGKQVSHHSAKHYIIMISACWSWLMEEKSVTEDPWAKVSKTIKIIQSQKARPFSIEEIKSIMTYLEESSLYCHYADLIAFLFDSGVRLGEAFGLRWRALDDQCKTAWIGEAATRGVRKETKTNTVRIIKLPTGLQERMRQRRDRVQPQWDDIVFPGKRSGKPINDVVLAKAWGRWLNELRIDYRSPYHTRHTWISHALANKMEPVLVAQHVGDNPATIYKHYAGVINSGVAPVGLVDVND